MRISDWSSDVCSSDLDVKRLTSIAPSLDVSNTQGETSGVQIRVRGVGTSGSNPGLESATGVSVDGVFLIRSNVALGDLLGIERIELLRGPQGTLFGKNTTAGVVNIITEIGRASCWERVCQYV